MKTIVSGILLTLLLVSMLTLAFKIPTIRAEAGPYYIRSDGSVYPDDGTILRDGDLYTLTGNISIDSDGIVIERNNMTLSGAGYTLQGAASAIGIQLSDRSNVTIKSIGVKNFEYGIYLWESNHCSIIGNNITNNGWGIALYPHAHYNSIVGNNITANYGCGIWGGEEHCSSNHNKILENNIARSNLGIYLAGSRNNSIIGNHIKEIRDHGIRLDWCSVFNIVENNVTDGFIGDTRAAITLYLSSNCNIVKNYLENNNRGIYLERSSNNTVSGNNATANNNPGISLGWSSLNNVSGNKVTANNYGGIYLYASSNNTVRRNVAIANNYGGIILDNSNNNIVSGNNATANNIYSGIHLSVSSNNIVSGNFAIANNYGGIQLDVSSNNIVSGNNATANNFVGGIYLHYFSNNNTVSGNSAANNTFGIHLQDANNNTVSGNNIINNSYGIFLHSSSNNSITTNNIAHNNWGFRFYSYINENACMHNTMYHNNFTDNYAQTIIDSESIGNTWNDTYPSGGNYWSDYTGTDLYSGSYQNETGSDGIGDVPYVIDATNRDNYPLMKPYPWASHDVGITSVTTSKTIVGQGYNVSIGIMAFNYGNYTENINITIYANTTIIGEINNIGIASRNFTIATFNWNTSGFAKGDYTIWAYATPVLNETDTLDNKYIDGIITVAMAGDLTADGTVDIFDIVIVAAQFGRPVDPPLPIEDQRADINNDGIVDVFDLVIVAAYFGQTDP